jgi:hypothetical protein
MAGKYIQTLKSAGTNEIVPALFQQGVKYLTTHLSQIFRACPAK